MKKEIFIEFLMFLICIVIILGAGYAFGFLNGFSAYDFKLAFSNISSIVYEKANSSDVEKFLKTENKDRTRRTVTYKDYRIHYIPTKITEISNKTGSWSKIFNSSKKVVFYVYDDNDNFHNAMTKTSSNLSKYYNFVVYSSKSFVGAGSVWTGDAKICNSLEECNAQRVRAAEYTDLTNFLTNCSKTMCVFAPSKQQYVQLKSKDINTAQKLLYDLKNW
jgi:hypothetical protein